jgi:hypothetical protein
MRILLLALPALILAGCGRNDAAANDAAALEDAAEQSTPEAAEVLRNAADAGGNVQDAMQAAGNAQAGGGSQGAPPSRGAKPHAPGDPVPPPQVGPAGNGQ